MATNCVPVEETVGADAGGGRTRQRPRARRTNCSGNSSNHHVHSHQFSPRDRVDTQATVLSYSGRQSSESYANRTPHTEWPIGQRPGETLETAGSELLTPRQETGFSNSEENIHPIPMLRIDLLDQETLLQPSLRLFTSLAEPNLLSPPLSPQPQDRELTTALIHYECDSPVQSQQEVGDILGTRLRQERIMGQERYDSEEFRCMESGRKLKHWGSHTFADIL